MTGASYDGGEHGSGSIVSRKSGLAHTGAVVNDKGAYFIVVTHVGSFGLKSVTRKQSSRIVMC